MAMCSKCLRVTLRSIPPPPPDSAPSIISTVYYIINAIMLYSNYLQILSVIMTLENKLIFANNSNQFRPLILKTVQRLFCLVLPKRQGWEFAHLLIDHLLISLKSNERL